MATDEEIIVKLTAQTAQLKAGMAEGAAVVKTTQDEMAASMQTSMNAFREFDSIQKGSITTAEELAAAQSAVQAAQASGAFTAEEIAEKEALVAAAMKNVGSETQAASGMLSMFTRNSRTMYSTSALITDAMTGQFSRMRREVAALGNETGIMAKAFTLAASPAGILTAGLVALGAAALQARDHIEEMQRAILESGNFAGTTTDKMAMMAQNIALGGADIKTAADSINALTTSGRISGEAMAAAARGVADFTTVVGGKSSDAIKEATLDFIKLGQQPVQEIARLNEQYNFLTIAQFDHINALQKEGSYTAAATAAQQAFSDAMHTRATTMRGDATGVEKAWQTAYNTITGHGEIEQSAASGTMQTRIKAITEELDFLATHANHLKNTLAPGGVNPDPVGAQFVAQLQAERTNLEAQLQQVNAAAQKEGAAAQSVQDHISQALHSHGRSGSATSGLEAELQKEEADQKVSYDKRLQFELNFWNGKLQTEAKGSAEYVAAWKHMQDLQKQLDSQQLADSSRTEQRRKEAARQASEEAKQAAQGRARAEQQASQEIQAEIKQESAARRAASLTDAQTTQQTALARIATARQTAQTEYSEGDITAAQLLQIENSLVSQKLAAEMAYIRAKQTLDQGDVVAEQKDAAQLVVVTQKADQERLQNLQRFHQQAEQQWRQYTQRVQGMVTSQVNAMLFQNQTLRSAVANIAQSMAETWIASEIKTLFSHQAVEAAKTASTIAGNTARVAADTAGQSESLAVQGASAIKWIMTEAAKAAAGAFNALAAIPGVGPFLAVGASIAAFATVAALVGKVASAEGGWERVPADGMMTQLHKDEMVLPKRIADPMRDLARGGGNGGVVHNHFQSFAPRDFAAYLKRNPAALRAALAHAGRNGW